MAVEQLADMDAAIEQRLEAIAEITATSCAGDSFEANLDRLCRLVCAALDAEACVVRELDGEDLVLRAQHGLPPNQLKPRLFAQQGIGQVLIETRRALTIADTQTSTITRGDGGSVTGAQFRSYAGAPMIAAGRIVGIVGVYMRDTTRHFSRSELLHLQTIANHLAVMLVNEALVAQMRAANEELDRRVNERTEALQAANADLEQFTYAVAHDLRTPLRTLGGFGTLLRQAYGPVLPEPALEMIDRQQRAAERMSAMIDDLLRLARLGRAALNLHRIDLSESARSVWDEMAVGREDEEATLHAEDGIVVDADPTLMAVVLQNLFDNSWKFRSPSRPLVVEFGKRSARSFFVRDNGIGFDPAHAGRLFRPLERLVPSNAFAGNGIGLATVRRIVEHHRGTVSAESSPGNGTTIVFSLGSRRGSARAATTARV